ncbi:hypothetical protein V8E54_009445 [Elaphomyces granulatus]
MLRMVPINPFEFFSAEGNECDDVEDELSNFFIFEAIRNAFKDEVDHIYFSDVQFHCKVSSSSNSVHGIRTQREIRAFR